MKKGFTLVELVIVIVIVGILSIVAVPIYRGYVEKAKFTEGKALVSAIRTAQQVYFAEHGEYYIVPNLVGYDPILQIDARGNKYFTTFDSNASGNVNVWWAYAADRINPDDGVALYWKIDNSAPATMGVHQVPVFMVRVDNKSTYYNS